MKKYAYLFLVACISPILVQPSMANSSSEKNSSKEENCPLAVTIAVSKTISYNFHYKEKAGEDSKYIENLPIIPSDMTSAGPKPFLDIVIINISKKNIKIPRFSKSYLTLKLISNNGKEYLLSGNYPSFGSSLRRPYNAHILEPNGCLVYRIYMDWHKFPKSLSGQKIKLQAIYKVKETTLKIKKIPQNNKKSEERKIELTKDLKLWHGEIRSPLREFILRWGGDNTK